VQKIKKIKPGVIESFSRIVDKRLEKYIDYERLENFYRSEMHQDYFQKFDSFELNKIDSKANESQCHQLLNLIRSILHVFVLCRQPDGTFTNSSDKSVNGTMLATTLFEFGNAGIFTILMGHYLGKLMVLIEVADPSSLRAGVLVNLCLSLVVFTDEERVPRSLLRQYRKLFKSIVRDSLPTISKYIISIYGLGGASLLQASINRRAYLEVLLQNVALVIKATELDSGDFLDKLSLTTLDVILEIFLSERESEPLVVPAGAILLGVLQVGSLTCITDLVFKLRLTARMVAAFRAVFTHEFRQRRLDRGFKYDAFRGAYKEIIEQLSRMTDARPDAATLFLEVSNLPTWKTLQEIYHQELVGGPGLLLNGIQTGLAGSENNLSKSTVSKAG
jgi:hypothetical protein